MRRSLLLVFLFLLSRPSCLPLAGPALPGAGEPAKTMGYDSGMESLSCGKACPLTGWPFLFWETKGEKVKYSDIAYCVPPLLAKV